MSVTPSHYDVLTNLLDVAQLQHRVIGQNIANVNTQGYKTKTVSFDELISNSLDDLTQPGVVEQLGVKEVDGLQVRTDGNNVDIDREMGQLSKNSLFYQTYSQLLASKLSMMRSAITGQ